MGQAVKTKFRRTLVKYQKEGLRCKYCGKKLFGWDEEKINKQNYNCECCGLICYHCQYWGKK